MRPVFRFPGQTGDLMDRLTRLLLEAQDGDPRALRQFVAETQHDVASLCRYLGDRDNADDLAQQTYERAIASLHRYRATGPAKHWLLTIARRTCADATRRRSRRRKLEQRIVNLAHDDVTVAPIDGFRAEWTELLDTLDDDRRAAFVVTQLNGLRYDEAAELLRVPIGTIRSRVSRAREQLVAAIAAADSGDDPKLGDRDLGDRELDDQELDDRRRRPGA
jgi:RNA polymerase sigma-70 factor (ECF subfamily)